MRATNGTKCTKGKTAAKVQPPNPPAKQRKLSDAMKTPLAVEENSAGPTLPAAPTFEALGLPPTDKSADVAAGAEPQAKPPQAGVAVAVCLSGEDVIDGDACTRGKNIVAAPGGTVVAAVPAPSLSAEDPAARSQLCVKCRQHVDIQDRGTLGNQRSKQWVHRRCVAAYKRRNRMNQKSKAMKAEWENKTPEEVVEWYIKNSVAALDEQSKADEIHHATAITSKSSSSCWAKNFAIPYSVFKHESEMKGWSEIKIKTEWAKNLVDPAIKKIKFGDEVMITRFQGVEYLSGMENALSSTVTSTARMKSSEELVAAMSGGRDLVNANHVNSQQWLNLTRSLCPDANHVSLPDDVVQGFLDDDDVALDDLAATHELVKDYADRLDQAGQRQTLLDNLMKEDQVEASIFAATSAEGEDAADQARFRASRNAEFSRNKEVFELTVSSLSSEIEQLLQGGQQALGQDNEASQEIVASFKNYKENLNKINEAWATEVQAFQKSFTDAVTVSDMKKTLQDMKSAKATKLKELVPLRKGVSQFKALVRKKEVGDIKGIRKVAGNKGNAGVGVEYVENMEGRVIQHFMFHVAIEKGPCLNCKQDVKTGVDRMTPMCIINVDQLKILTSNIKFLQPVLTWLSQQLLDKLTVSCTLEKAKHIQPLDNVLSEIIHKDAMEKPYSVVHDWLGGYFAYSLQKATGKWSSVGYFAYGLGQWTVPIDGTMLLVALKATSIDGDSFSEKHKAFTDIPPDELAKRVQADGFYVKLEVGSAAWCPPGYIHALYVTSNSASFLKWASFGSKGKDAAEMRSVLSSATSMVSSFPTLGPHYKEWLDFLEQHFKTAGSVATGSASAS